MKIIKFSCIHDVTLNDVEGLLRSKRNLVFFFQPAINQLLDGENSGKKRQESQKESQEKGDDRDENCSAELLYNSINELKNNRVWSNENKRKKFVLVGANL